MEKTSRRNVLKKTAQVAAVATGGAVLADNASAQTSAPLEKRNPAAAPLAPGQTAPRTMYGASVAYSNLLFLSGVGYHDPGTIEDATKHVIAELEQNLIKAGSTLQKVLKVNVYLNDLRDYDRMNAVYRTYDWGSVAPVRTTVSPAAGIPGNSLIEIDMIAYI
jgi:2-iminobutanoate/2-iminopropanoate deaminase